MWYNVNWFKYVLLMLPTFLRKENLDAYLSSLIVPIAILHNDFLRNRKNNLDKLKYTGQVCYLRGALNDKYDPFLRRITIENPIQVPQNYIYTAQENKDVYLGVMYIEQDFNYEGADVNFIVNVPSEVWQEYSNYIISVIELYRLVGKTYRIVEI